MWTTSNCRGDYRRAARAWPMAACAIGLWLGASCLWAQGSGAPLPPRPAPDDERPRSVAPEQPVEPVELASLEVRGADFDELVELVGDERPRGPLPLLVEVRLAKPVKSFAGTSWPIVLLNGQELQDTQFLRDEQGRIVPDKLVAAAPRTLVKEQGNEVSVVWVGRESLTLTKNPLTFSEQDVKEKEAGEDPAEN